MDNEADKVKNRIVGNIRDLVEFGFEIAVTDYIIEEIEEILRTDSEIFFELDKKLSGSTDKYEKALSDAIVSKMLNVDYKFQL